MTLPPSPFTSLVGCRLPLQQAGMGGVTTPALAAAVAREGALGMIAAAGLPVEAVVAQPHTATDAAGANGRVGVNFLVPFLDERALDAASTVAAVVECFYGDPDGSIVRRIHDGGASTASMRPRSTPGCAHRCRPSAPSMATWRPPHCTRANPSST